jgi:hypothetical protein
VWNLVTFKSGASLAPAELGLPEIPQALADALREHILAPLHVRLEGPSKVGFYMFGDACAFYNFRDEPVRLRLNGRAIDLGANRILWWPKSAGRS